MLQKRWVQWLAIGMTLGLGGAGMTGLLNAQGLPRAAVGLAIGTVTVSYLWMVIGVFGFAQARWLLWSLLHQAVGAAGVGVAYSFFYIAAIEVGLALIAVAGIARGILVFRAYSTHLAWRLVAVGLLGIVDLGWLCWLSAWYGFVAVAIALGGMYLMVLAFMLGLWLIRAAVYFGHPVAGVARTAIEEALRMKVVLVLTILIMLVLPVLPYASESSELLKYRIGTFLAWALSATMVLLGVMTVFLSCWTVCGEVRHKQIHLTLTKPINRFQYLLGKWIGICLLNLLLLIVAGGGIYTFARIMEQLPARDNYDRQSISNQVLVARVPALPELPDGQSIAAKVEQRIEQIEAEGLVAGDIRRSDDLVNVVVNAWHTVEYLGSQTYVFSGLDKAGDRGDTVQLKLKMSANNRPDSGKIHFTMRVNGRPFSNVPPLTLTHVHVIPIPTALIDDAGRLEIVIINQNPVDKALTFQTDISFTPDEGFQLLYRYGPFGPNLVRGIMMIWVQLCFVSMVGLAAGSFLGFPVACLLSLLVYGTAVLSGFLNESITAYAGVGSGDAGLWDLLTSYPTAFWTNLVEGKPWDSIKVIIRVVAELFVTLVPSLHRYNPISQIADGQAVRWSTLGEAVLMIGVVWSGLTAVVAYLIFRRRELARVTV